MGSGRGDFHESDKLTIVDAQDIAWLSGNWGRDRVGIAIWRERTLFFGFEIENQRQALAGIFKGLLEPSDSRSVTA